MRSRGWNWLSVGAVRQPLLVGLTQVAMRLCWLYPWIEMVSYSLFRLDRPFIPLWLTGLILLASWGLALWATNREAVGPSGQAGFWRWQLSIAGLGLGLLLWLLWWRLYREPKTLCYPIWNIDWVEHLVRDLTSWQGVLLPLTLTLMGAYLWWRGIADGRTPPWHETIFRSFSVGFSWLVALAILSHYWPVFRPPTLWPATLAFVVSALAALALVDLDEVRRRGGGGARALFTVNRYWLFTLLTTIGLITLLGLALSIIAAPSRIAALLTALAPLLDFLARILIPVIYYLILAIAYLLFLILTPLARALNRLLRFWMPQLAQKPFQDRFASQLEQLERGRTQAPPWLGVTVKAAFLLLLVGGIGFIFALALRRYTRRDEEGVEETRELIWSPEIMREEWRALIRRLRRRGRKTREAQSPFLPLLGVDRDRRAIRQVYQQLLAWAGEQGLPRPPGATPHEYAAILDDHYAAPEWCTIAHAYTQARYAVDPLPPELVAQVQGDWLRLSYRWQKHEHDQNLHPAHAGPAC